MIAGTGLKDVIARRVEGDAAQVYYVATKPARAEQLQREN